jgi:hypothetical protein
MKSIKYLIAVTAILVAVSSTNTVQAQGFNPEDMKKRMLEGYRGRLDVKDNDEWALISERIGKILEIRFSAFSGRGGPGGGRGGPGGTRGGDRGGDRGRPEADGGGDRARTETRGGDRGGDNRGGGNRTRGNRTRGGGDPNSASGKLSAAIEANASGDEIKSLLGKLRAERKAAADKLKKAQDELREVLTSRQEAIMVVSRMLD